MPRVKQEIMSHELWTRVDGYIADTLIGADPVLAAALRDSDADKIGYPDYLRLALPLCRVGAVIVADNIVREGEVANAASTDEAVRAVRAFNAALAAEPRVAATIIQTVGVKKYDGFALVLVTG